MNDKTNLQNGETIEDLQNGFSIIQNDQYFSFGTDAVLLSHFADIREGERAVDLGTGCGIIPVLLCAKTKAAHILGLEIQPELADMARRSVALNGLEDRIDIVCGDLRNVLEYIDHGVDAVVCNPPYEKAGAGKHNANESVNIAKREVKCTLDDVILSASKVLRTGGRFYIIHRTQRFAELMAKLRAKKIEPKRVTMVAPRQNEAPNFALVQACKGAAEGVVFTPPLVVYEPDGSYTPPLKEIYGIGEDKPCCTS